MRIACGVYRQLNRDTMSFATKLNFIEYEDGSTHEVMKKPKTDADKISFPGYMAVRSHIRPVLVLGMG